MTMIMSGPGLIMHRKVTLTTTTNCSHIDLPLSLQTCEIQPRHRLAANTTHIAGTQTVLSTYTAKQWIALCAIRSPTYGHANATWTASTRPASESVVLVKGDLLDIDKSRDLLRQCLQALGRLDVVINNDSSFYPMALGEASGADWETLMGSNLRPPIFLLQEAAPELRKQHGCVVNLVDVYAARPLKDHPIYSTAKAGLVALTRSLARELAPEVRVNAVVPGAILWPEGDDNELAHQRITTNTRLKRAGTPGEIADAVMFLAVAARFTTGHRRWSESSNSAQNSSKLRPSSG